MIGDEKKIESLDAGLFDTADSPMAEPQTSPAASDDSMISDAAGSEDRRDLLRSIVDDHIPGGEQIYWVSSHRLRDMMNAFIDAL
jgi:hypothetical protein